jgi:hypothetical protein
MIWKREGRKERKKPEEDGEELNGQLCRWNVIINEWRDARWLEGGIQRDVARMATRTNCGEAQKTAKPQKSLDYKVLEMRLDELNSCLRMLLAGGSKLARLNTGRNQGKRVQCTIHWIMTMTPTESEAYAAGFAL